MDSVLCTDRMEFDYDSLIAQRLREVREDNDLSQDEVAAYLHMSQPSYSRRETGRHYFSAGEALAAAQFMKTDIKKIFF